MTAVHQGLRQELRQELRTTGRPASPGLAAGPLVVIGAHGATRTPTGDPAREAAALADAIGRAIRDLEGLRAVAGADGADMLEFQVAMLEDEALAAPAHATIAAGAPADRAWADAMAAEIAGYEAAEDEYFRARAADLADIRDRVLGHLTGTGGGVEELPAGAVIAADDLTPSKFLSIDWSSGGGIVLGRGSPSSHVAMLARARAIPMVVGLGDRLPSEGCWALVDGSSGEIVLDPDPGARNAFDRRRTTAAEADTRTALLVREPAAMADGTPVRVLLNVADPAELDALDPAICDGIGLVRTEFLFHGGTLPDEDAQAAVYTRIAAWAAGRPVTFRTIDAGGDKPVPGLTPIGESNPFLGVRGIRLSLAHPDVFKVQLRALARAAVAGNIKVMLPMVAVAGELARASALLDEAVAELAAAGVPHRRPPLGIMVEVPAAALSAAQIPADFYSIGSNDLTQYTMAAARDIGAVAALNNTGDPAVLELIRMTVAAADARGVEVSLCGDAAADPALVPKLLDAGLRSLSVPPVAVGRVKEAISAFGKGS
jgi:phosphoenolpyruvate-protein phosphotransferase (PTS system enzyme I)